MIYDIIELDLSSKGITELPDLSIYPNLRKLYCYQNNLTKIDNLPNGLEFLECANNLITNLDNLPSSLKELYCCNNQLTKLDNLPNGLRILKCPLNRIIELDCLPCNLEILDCSYPLTGFEFLKKSKTVIRIAVKN